MMPPALYRRFDELGLDIKEYFVLQDAELLRRLLEQVGRQGMRVAEVGAWKGCSTAVIGDFVKSVGGDVVSIDNFGGNPGTWNVGEAMGTDLEALHRANMAALGLGETVETVRANSVEYAETVADGSLDLVFIDADHRYSTFMADLKAWVPKVKGIICGHDHDGLRYAEQPAAARAVIDDCLEVDYISGLGHPGIIRGCHDVFEAYECAWAAGGGSMWWVDLR
jgi:hypothetical protein